MSGHKETISIEAIIDCSVRLFREKGYRSTSLEEVAEAFGVKRQAIYHYFNNKNDILFCIIDRMLKKFTAEIDDAFRKSLPHHEKFIRVLIAHAKVAMEFSSYVAVWQEERKQLPEDVKIELNKIFMEYHEEMFKLYDQGVETGNFIKTNTKYAVLTLLGACTWSYNWYEEGCCEPDKLASEIVNFISKGFIKA